MGSPVSTEPAWRAGHGALLPAVSWCAPCGPDEDAARSSAQSPCGWSCRRQLSTGRLFLLATFCPARGPPRSALFCARFGSAALGFVKHTSHLAAVVLLVSVGR